MGSRAHKASKWERVLAHQIRAFKLPNPVMEFCFAAEHVGAGPGVKRRLEAARLKNWRFDFAWPDQVIAGGHRLAVEVEGGRYVYGRHQRPGGFSEDCRKYHEALRLGWTVYRCEDELIRSGRAVQLIATLLARGGLDSGA